MVIAPKNGNLAIWIWGDYEVDNPKSLKARLEEILSLGFSGIMVVLGPSRYAFNSPLLVRAIAQLSQWTTKRGAEFWFNPDPRQASRHFINRTGEKLQNLMTLSRPSQKKPYGHPQPVPVLKDHFRCRFKFVHTIPSSLLQEQAIAFEPSGIEKVFLFQMDGNVILADTVKDITPYSQFFINMEKRYTEVFGRVRIPEGEKWYVLALPKLDTNLYDFAGRDSNDLFLEFVEDLFDACTHLEGITWGWGKGGYLTESGRLPVSISIYNNFRSDYGYDLRDALYGLALDVDDGSHTKIRNDYYTLLIRMVREAQKDMFNVTHSFFSGIQLGYHWYDTSDTDPSDLLVQGNIDPWYASLDSSSVICDFDKQVDIRNHTDHFLSTLVISKSLGHFSKQQKAYMELCPASVDQATMTFLTDLMALYSIRPLIRNFRGQGSALSWREDEKYPEESHRKMISVNQRMIEIGEVTGFKFPVANVLVYYPVETLMGADPDHMTALYRALHSFLARLIYAGYQADVVSSVWFTKGRLTPKGYQVGNQIYPCVLCPYPEILDPKALEILSQMEKSGFSMLIGGSSPQYTTRGRRIPHNFSVSFDPGEKDLSSLREAGIHPLLSLPQNSIGSIIWKKEGHLVLLAPRKSGATMKGSAGFGKASFDISPEKSLSVYFLGQDGKSRKVL